MNVVGLGGTPNKQKSLFVYTEALLAAITTSQNLQCIGKGFGKVPSKQVAIYAYECTACDFCEVFMPLKIKIS